MAALVCDLCGGKLVMGSGGVATCENCGMQHSVERMREKLQGNCTPAQTDNTHLIDNYMRMAQNAYESNNKLEAENYCNRVLEISPDHQEAWLLKGRAAGWQSTLGNIRFPEAINCFAKAVNLASDAERESVINECKQEIGELAEALIRLRGDRFAKWPDKDEKNGFLHDLTAVLEAILQFFKAVGTLVDKDKIMGSLATIINNSVISAWNNVVQPTFANDHNGYPDNFELSRLVERGDLCIDLLEQAINLRDANDEDDIKRYENLIAIHEYLINASSYSYETVALEGSFWNDYQTRYENQYVKSRTLTDEAKSYRRQQISKYERKIAAIKSAAAAKKAAENEKHKKEFWEKFPEERAAILSAISRLKQERARLSASNTGFNQIKLIDSTQKSLSEILHKNRDSKATLTYQERSVINGLSTLWEKLKNVEEDDAFFDQNPLLKEEASVRNKLDEHYENLRKAQAPADWSWITRIIICTVLICLFAYLYTPVAPDFSNLIRGVGRLKNSVGALLIMCVFLYIPIIIGIIACLYVPIHDMIEEKKKVSELKDSIRKCEAMIKKIEDIKAEKWGNNPPAAYFSASKTPKDYSQYRKDYSKLPMNVFLTILFSGISAGFIDICYSTKNFKDYYLGILEGMVGHKAYTSAYLACLVWISASLIVGYLGKVIVEEVLKKRKN